MSEEAKGLMRLLRIMARSYAAYMKLGKDGKGNMLSNAPDFAKQVIPIMPRTSLADLYVLLSSEEQKMFKNGHKAITEYIFDNENNHVLAGKKDNVFIRGRLKYAINNTVTYKTWAESLPDATVPDPNDPVIPK